MASVSLQHIYKVYTGNVTAVSDFCLDIEDKEFIVLVGPSGCGKSTTLRMVAGLEEISDGELYIGDKLVNDVAPKDRDIAMVFQNYALYPHMTVYDNMAFGLKLRKTPKDEIKRRVEEAAKILDIAHLLSRKPKALSGGQRQRVALGRAIVREPKVFLFDEPLSNLDAKLRVAMRTEITKLHQRLHVQQVDTPQNLYDYPANEFVAGFIGSPQMNFFNVKLDREGQDVVATFGDNKIVVPEKKVAKFVDESFIGKEVIMGIRPENIHDDEQKLAEYATATIDVDVEVTELMGSETYLYLSTTGKEGNIIARVDPRTSSKAGQKIKIALDTNHLHFFDKETEKTILSK